MNTETENVFGLLGIMGSGKSTVAAGLATHGAIVLDADEIARQLQQPGEPVLKAMANVLGRQILDTSGALDRHKVAQIIFSDDGARGQIENIVHPPVVERMNQAIQHAKPTDVIILDASTLIAPGHIQVPHIIAVDSPVDSAVERSVKYLGFMEADVRARIASQMSRDDMLTRADYVIHNSGSKNHLESEIETAWLWITSHVI